MNTGQTPAWPAPGQSIDAHGEDGEFKRTPPSASASGVLSPSGGWCEKLYHAKAAELILYGRALGLSHAEAEDVVQETFLALLQKETEPENPTHYCVRSFRNRAFNYRRSFWRRLTREFEAKRWFERTPDESPAEQKAMRCLAELPIEQREIIVLKLWHDLTFEEIGGLLELSPNTAAGRYRYGLEKLRSRLKKGDMGQVTRDANDPVISPVTRHLSPRGERVKYEGESYERDEHLGDTIAFLDAAPPLAGT